MGGIISFFLTIIDAIVSFVDFLGKGVDFLFQIVSALPAIVVVPVTAGIAILIIFAIIGRGS